jgi:hypothetical protein
VCPLIPVLPIQWYLTVQTIGFCTTFSIIKALVFKYVHSQKYCTVLNHTHTHTHTLHLVTAAKLNSCNTMCMCVCVKGGNPIKSFSLNKFSHSKSQDNLIPKFSHVINIHVVLLISFPPKKHEKSKMEQTVYPLNTFLHQNLQQFTTCSICQQHRVTK